MRSPPLLWYFPYYQHTTVVCGGGGLNKYQGPGADCLQRPLRSRFRQQLTPGVGLQVILDCHTGRGWSRPMPAIITPARPDTADTRALIAELEAYLAPLYPHTSRHGYSIEQLIAEAVAFFLLRHDG